MREIKIVRRSVGWFFGFGFVLLVERPNILTDGSSRSTCGRSIDQSAGSSRDLVEWRNE